MSAILPPAYGLKDQTQKYVIAVRSGRRGQDRIVATGNLHCVSCGATSISMADFARYAGVSARDVSNFLNRRPVREDVAARIRSKLHGIDE